LQSVLKSITDGLAVLDKNWRVREHLAMMKRNIDLEIKLINELLDLSRKVELEIETVALNEIVRHVCESYRSQMRRRDIRLEAELYDAGALIAADSARLQQVLRNVLEMRSSSPQRRAQSTQRQWAGRRTVGSARAGVSADQFIACVGIKGCQARRRRLRTHAASGDAMIQSFGRSLQDRCRYG
jgi:nitrogen fixation/metabolism regulation signal transduction histidine kinase